MADIVKKMASGFLGLMVAAFVLGGCGEMNTGGPLKAPNMSGPKYGLFEVVLKSEVKLDNPFTDAQAEAVFTSPSGKDVAAEGFYFGQDEMGVKQWRVRFVPREHGRWRYAATLKASGNVVTNERGQFDCQGTQGHGFLRLSARNPYRMEYDDGTPFYPIGIQTCSFLQPDFDGPGPDGKRRSTTAEEWGKEFEGAVNLVRTQMGQGTTAGCALPLIAAGDKKAGVPPGPTDRYDLNLALRIDEAFKVYRERGMSQILILFQDMSLWGDGQSAFGSGRDVVNYKSKAAANLPAQERYIRYIVARFGCFVDIWELFNEDSFAPDDYLAHLAAVIRKADPYGHLITTNYARPSAAWSDIITWHEYMGMPANDVDPYLSQQIGLYKSYGKVVQNTEFGNQGGLSNVDPIKWRVAVWTAFTNESGVLFWGMSGRKVQPSTAPARGNANAYIGPDSRQHFRVLADFTRDMPVDMKPAPIGYTRHKDIRAYALGNGLVTAVYVHHFADYQKEYKHPDKLMVQTGPGRFKARWINPADGKEVAVDEFDTPQQYSLLAVPPVKIDLACRIDRTGLIELGANK
ncbi:MAG: DUF5060 domain-containing protein [Phycisphaerae bacterium]